MSSIVSSAHAAAAREAVRPKQVNSKNGSPAMAAYKTPSFTKIVESYNKDGNGDREMLLALLQAKAKEDERLAALDILKAEQLRAYSHHLAIHGPVFGQHFANYHHLPPPMQSAVVSPPTPVYSSGSPSPQLSCSTSSTHSPRSRSSSSSATDVDQVRTPSDEPKCTSAFLPLSKQTSPSSVSSVLPPPCPATFTRQPFGQVPVELPNLKRKRSSCSSSTSSVEDNLNERASSSHRLSPIVASRRTSQVSLPGINSFHDHPASTSTARRTSPASSSSSARRAGGNNTPSSPGNHSLRHLLNNDELRSMGNSSNTRVQMSDLRSSGSSRDEADDEE